MILACRAMLTHTLMRFRAALPQIVHMLLQEMKTIAVSLNVLYARRHIAWIVEFYGIKGRLVKSIE